MEYKATEYKTTCPLQELFQRIHGPLRNKDQVVFRLDGGWLPDGGRWAAAAVKAEEKAGGIESDGIRYYYSGGNVSGTRDYGNWNDACAEGMAWIAALQVLLHGDEQIGDDQGIVFFIDRQAIPDGVLSQRIKFGKNSSIGSWPQVQKVLQRGDNCNWEYLLVLKMIGQRIYKLLHNTDRMLCVAMRMNDIDYSVSGFWRPDQCCKDLMRENPPAAENALPFEVSYTSFQHLTISNRDWEQIFVQKVNHEPVILGKKVQMQRWYFMAKEAAQKSPVADVFETPPQQWEENFLRSKIPCGSGFPAMPNFPQSLVHYKDGERYEEIRTPKIRLKAVDEGRELPSGYSKEILDQFAFQVPIDGGHGFTLISKWLEDPATGNHILVKTGRQEYDWNVVIWPLPELRLTSLTDDGQSWRRSSYIKTDHGEQWQEFERMMEVYDNQNLGEVVKQLKAHDPFNTVTIVSIIYKHRFWYPSEQQMMSPGAT